MPASVTPIDVPAERGCATPRDRPKDGPLLGTQPRMLRDEGVTLRVEDIGHLHGRPGHDGLVGLRFSRDRGRTTGAGTCSCSNGFGAAWRCRCDKCRYTVVCVRSAWPRRTWIVRKSAPASRRCVAYECRSVWGLTRRSIPAVCAAKRTASQMHLEVSGLSARQPCSCPGKRYV